MKLRLRAARRGPRCNATKSCDSYDEFRLCTVNIVVDLVDVYGECSLTWLLGVCNHDLANSLLAFVEQSILQVWYLYLAQFMSCKWFLECQLNANVVWYHAGFVHNNEIQLIYMYMYFMMGLVQLLLPLTLVATKF